MSSFSLIFILPKPKLHFLCHVFIFLYPPRFYGDFNPLSASTLFAAAISGLVMERLPKLPLESDVLEELVVCWKGFLTASLSFSVVDFSSVLDDVSGSVSGAVAWGERGSRRYG
jgi:hypothetical protein